MVEKTMYVNGEQLPSIEYSKEGRFIYIGLLLMELLILKI